MRAYPGDMIEGPFDVQEAKRMPNGVVHVRVAFTSETEAGDAIKHHGLCVFIFDLEDPTGQIDVNDDHPNMVPTKTAELALGQVRSMVQEMTENLIVTEAG